LFFFFFNLYDYFPHFKTKDLNNLKIIKNSKVEIMSRSYKLIGIMIIFIAIGLSGCNNINFFKIESKYDYIQSYGEGGGIFPIYLKTPYQFEGNISLELSADSELNAQLTTYVLNNSSQVADIIVQPIKNITKGIHRITISSVDGFIPMEHVLEVEIFDINISEPSSYIMKKKDELLSWFETTHPDYENISDSSWFPYRTYQKVLVVEHWTFLNDEYELRICCHITIPPYNWSKMSLRPLGEIEPVLAFHREYDGKTMEIPVSEYPILYGY
jgi:hypothetical protein